MIPVKNKVLIR